MLVASWNVNSVKARNDRLLAWVAKHSPDILCLQELKVITEKFPDLIEHGYFATVYGQKTYNGVAIVSKEAPDEVRIGFQDEQPEHDARVVAARFKDLWVVSIYVPNGQKVGSEKYFYKLQWLARFRQYLDRHYKPTDKVLVAGDMNVAPEERDVEHPDFWRQTVLFHETVVAAYNELIHWGLRDCFRKYHLGSGHYSWWDYRMLGFAQNDGLRIDNILATESLLATTLDAWIDRDERKGKLPSDHAPVLVEFI
jgi:exodeoxyribonuclease III